MGFGRAAVVLSSQGGFCSVKLESTGEPVQAVPWSSLMPVPPTKPGDMVLGASSSFFFPSSDDSDSLSATVLGGANRGIQAETQSRDGNEWMVRYLSAPTETSNILEAALLGVLA